MRLPARPRSTLESRSAVAADARELAALAARTFIEAFAAQNDPDDLAAYVAEAFSVARIEAELREPESFFLLGTDPSAGLAGPVGYSRLVGARREDGITGPRPVELQRIYVDAEHRSSGYGSALMWDSLSLARSQGYRTVWLGVWEHNYGAQRFYQRWDFTVVGSHDFVLGSDRQTDLLMARPV